VMLRKHKGLTTWVGLCVEGLRVLEGRIAKGTQTEVSYFQDVLGFDGDSFLFEREDMSSLGGCEGVSAYVYREWIMLPRKVVWQ